MIADDCVSGDLPEVLLALDRLPPKDATGGRLIDPFGALFVASLEAGGQVGTSAALHSDAAQERLRHSLAACPYAVTRGNLDGLAPGRWSEETRSWFLDRFESVTDDAASVVLWRAS